MGSVKDNGGKREGAGRKPKRDEDKQRVIFESALKRITGEEETDESKILFLVDFALEKEGKKFIAEHVFGKAPQVNENRNMDVLEEKVGVLFNKAK
tara:strand:+ start:147 stop:434 length:288 start_codon:yes stop_codon:yes gene_type:complete